MWFESWTGVVRTLLVGSAAYLALIMVLRASGKRTLSKLNAFDLVVTVALGSTLATILLNADVSFAEGVAALALLAALQFVVALVISRFPAGRQVVTAHPTLLVSGGQLRHEAMQAQRVSENEVRQAVRSSGHGDLSRIDAVVLESDGSLSVITADKAGDRSALTGVDE